MSQLSPSERMSTVRLRVDRMRRSMTARLMLSPILRWRFGAPIADELLIVPRDLRTADPCFFDEFEDGQFGFGGFVAPLDGASPFALRPPSPQWSRELHGFGWLRHLRTRQEPEAGEAARALVVEWIQTRRGKTPIAREPQVIGRRVISWITCAHTLLAGDSQTTYDLITDSLADQIIHLSATWRDAPEGHPRLLAIMALVYADLCVAGRDKQLAGVEQQFAAEIGRQILGDGGHISRNPEVLVELLLDLLPLNQCFKSRDRKPPAALQSAVDRMLPMVQFLRLGDKSLARFNGVGPPADDAVATVMAYLPADLPAIGAADQSGYVRLEAGESVAIMDAGAAAPLAFAGDAHAGCLSFEFSAGRQPVFVNCGAPGICDMDWRPASRGTASHNTLALGGKSSAKLVRNSALEEMLGAIPLRYPEKVVVQRGDGGRSVTAHHDGYINLFGLIHSRTLALSEDGLTLSGRDQIGSPQGRVRLAKDLPFAVHFHLHKSISPLHDEAQDTVVLGLDDGSRWQFTASGGIVSIEDSVNYADLAGPCAAEQIVIRGACAGEVTVTWSCRRL